MQPENVVMLNIDLLTPNPNQPRKTFDEIALNELAMSIKEYGILNPILARKKEEIYEIIAGERRYRAAKIAGLTEVPVIIKNIEESKIAEIALIENLQRENITPIEEAKTFNEILKSKNITEQQLSELIGKSQPFIANKIRLLKLPETIQNALNNKKISEKHARSLLTVDDQQKQEELLSKIINERLSVRELDNIIQNKKEEKESDNMNNGNFFPNFNANEQNSNASLNSMNMQAMPNQEMAPATTPTPAAPIVNMPSPVEQVVNSAPTMPQTESVAAPLPQVEIQNMEPTAPAMPNLTNAVESPIPDFGINATVAPSEPAPTQVASILPTPMDNTPQPVEIPVLSDTSAGIPTEASVAPPVAPILEASTPVAETPLFNSELTNPTPTPAIEVPVNTAPSVQNQSEDQVTKIEQLLSSNNINYKSYSNETGHCIIIEL